MNCAASCDDYLPSLFLTTRRIDSRTAQWMMDETAYMPPNMDMSSIRQSESDSPHTSLYSTVIGEKSNRKYTEELNTESTVWELAVNW